MVLPIPPCDLSPCLLWAKRVESKKYTNNRFTHHLSVIALIIAPPVALGMAGYPGTSQLNGNTVGYNKIASSRGLD